MYIHKSIQLDTRLDNYFLEKRQLSIYIILYIKKTLNFTLLYKVDTDSRQGNATTRVKIGSLIVELQQGDITRETTDVIVNNVGQGLNMDGKYSRK